MKMLKMINRHPKATDCQPQIATKKKSKAEPATVPKKHKRKNGIHSISRFRA
jgi:hypothetical protein